MKVILLNDIKGTGIKGEIIKTSDGHARNYLIPRKMAVEATEANIRELEFKKKNLKRIQAEELTGARAFAKELGNMDIVLHAKAGEGSRLFGSITSKDLSEALKEQHNLEIDKRKIILKNPIKELGTYEIEIKVYPQVKGTLKVTITSEK
jgi:large subunit ribosomal protein L9